ncbi:hypothetical protein ACFVYE_39330 [Streptomyces sp. NPDC058239]|uniref:hypothetical protein n=1 Tax=unclassified Streptomyces TaxID=2593676 RepID=UPI00364AD229
MHWGQNTRAASPAGPELRQEGDWVIMSGLLHLTDDGAAHLQMGHWSVLFDLARPVPSSLDGSWVQISVGSESVALHPYQAEQHWALSPVVIRIRFFAPVGVVA